VCKVPVLNDHIAPRSGQLSNYRCKSAAATVSLGPQAASNVINPFEPTTIAITARRH